MQSSFSCTSSLSTPQGVSFGNFPSPPASVGSKAWSFRCLQRQQTSVSCSGAAQIYSRQTNARKVRLKTFLFHGNFNRASRLIRDCIGFVSLYSVIDLENRAFYSTNQMQDVKTSRDLVTRVFPRSWQFACFKFEFSSARDNVNLRSDWPLWLHQHFAF